MCIFNCRHCKFNVLNVFSMQLTNHLYFEITMYRDIREVEVNALPHLHECLYIF